MFSTHCDLITDSCSLIISAVTPHFLRASVDTMLEPRRVLWGRFVMNKLYDYRETSRRIEAFLCPCATSLRALNVYAHDIRTANQKL